MYTIAGKGVYITPFIDQPCSKTLKESIADHACSNAYIWPSCGHNVASWPNMWNMMRGASARSKFLRIVDTSPLVKCWPPIAVRMHAVWSSLHLELCTKC